MGHQISNYGISPDEKKIEAIINFRKPEYKNDIQRFLGMLIYISRIYPKSFATRYTPAQFKKKRCSFWMAGYPWQMFSGIKKFINKQTYTTILKCKQTSSSFSRCIKRRTRCRNITQRRSSGVRVTCADWRAKTIRANRKGILSYLFWVQEV